MISSFLYSFFYGVGFLNKRREKPFRDQPGTQPISRIFVAWGFVVTFTLVGERCLEVSEVSNTVSMWLSCSGSCLGILLFAIPFVTQKDCVVWRRFHWSRRRTQHLAQRDSVRAWSHNETHQMVYFLHAVYLLSLPTLLGAENQWRLEDEAQVWEKLKAQLSDLSNLMNFSSNVKPLEIRASLCIYRWNRSCINGRSVVTTGELPTSATQLRKCCPSAPKVKIWEHSTKCGQNTNYVFDKEIARDGSNEINGDRFDEVKRMASIKDNSTRKTWRIRPANTKNGWQEKGVLHSM